VAYHYVWVPFHVTLLAQAGGTSGDTVSDALPNLYRRTEVKPFHFSDSFTNPEPQEEKKIVVLMALWYSQYKLLKNTKMETGPVNWENKADPFSIALNNDIKLLVNKFKEMGINREKRMKSPERNGG
jgi:hypothetical protein